MFDRLTSVMSKVNSLFEKARELPGALRGITDVAREHASTQHEVEFWKSARDRWMDWACHIDGGQLTPGTTDCYDGDSEMRARITAAILENAELRRERDTANSELVSIARERAELRTNLSRYEAAETWRQVTSGNGEWPPKNVPVIWQHNHPDFPRDNAINVSCQGGVGTYRWRFLSSEDVPNAK